MVFIRLWTDFLSHTRPVLEGGALGILFVYVQMGVGASLPLATLFRLVRRESVAERILLCIVPTILILTAAIVEPLFFGSFLGSGFTRTAELRAFLGQPAFFREALALCAAFSLLAAAYLALDRGHARLSLVKLLLNVGLEALLVLAAVTLSADFLLGGGRLFQALGDTVLKWLVYGLYLLLNKSCLYLICLLWCLLFSQRELIPGPNGPFTYMNWLKRRMAGGYRAVGCGLTLFAAFYFYFVVYRLYAEAHDGSAMPAGMAAMGTALAVPGLFCLAVGLFPRLRPNYRRMLRWDEPELTASRIYRELVEQEPLRQERGCMLTDHYLVLCAPLQRIFYRPLLLKCTALPMDTYLLLFQDGSRCRLNNPSMELLRQLCGGVGYLP